MINKRLLLASLMTLMLFATPALAESYTDLLKETTNPNDLSIQIGDKFYDLNPLNYNKGTQVQQKYIWDVDTSGLATLVEYTGEPASNTLSIYYNQTPNNGGRRKADLQGADFAKNIIGASTTKEYGGGLINSSGFSIGELSSFFVNNHTMWEDSNKSSFGGAIYNAGTIKSITGDFIANYLSVNKNGATINSGFGGAISSNDGSIDSIKSNFISNYVIARNDVHGGAIHNTSLINSIESNFVGNYTKSLNNHSYGGAVSNRKGGKIGAISGDFIRNYTYNSAGVAVSESQNFDAQGGAISNIQNSSVIGSVSGTFIANYAQSENNIAKGGAIFNSTGTASIGEIAADFIGNYTLGDRGAYGGAIFNNTVKGIKSVAGDFKGNYAKSASGDALGGAIYNENTASEIAQIRDITGVFESNYAIGKTFAKGGAIYNSQGIIDSIEADFINNYAQSTGSGSFGGAIYNNNATINLINGTFIGNNIAVKKDYAYGGSIYNAGTIDKIKGEFEGNYLDVNISGMGGAIANGIKTASLEEIGIINSIEANFSENYVKSSSDVHGGAIQNAVSEIGTIAGNFIENYTESTNSHAYGGAVANRKGGIISSIIGDFKGNYTYNSSAESASKDVYGGAVANYQDNSEISYLRGNFTENYAKSDNNSANGGAIFNGTDRATIKEVVANFMGNYAEGKVGAYGGAIYNNVGTKTKARIESITGDFAENYVKSQNEAFGGAIFNRNTSTQATNIAHIGDIKGNFKNNYAEGHLANGGAIYSSKAIINSIEGDFGKNRVSSDIDAFGGAIYNKNSTIGSIKSDFTGNKSVLVPATGSSGVGRYASGGAIYNIEGAIGDIAGDFSENYSLGEKNNASGGAIANRNSIIGAVTGDFTNNYSIGNSDSSGGAIFNSNGDITFVDSSFIGNATTGVGGAIANYAGDTSVSTINIVADNADVKFTGNKGQADISVLGDSTISVSNGVSNAIFNALDSVINLNAKEGKSITFNDDITGDYGIININKENAYLTLDSNLKEILKDIDQTGGDYIFNATVSGNTLNLFNGGTITIGEEGGLDLYGFKNDVKNGILDAANVVVQDLILGATELDSDLNFKMDLNVTNISNIQSDTITVDGDNSYGNIVLSEINLVGKVLQDFTESTEITHQVLFNADTDTTISLGTDVLNDFNTTVTLDITGSDEWSGPDINWNADFGEYTITRTIESTISVTSSDTAQQLQDTLDWIVLVSDGDKDYGDKADNLALVNQFTTTDDRHFNFDSANDEFVASKNSGITAGGKLVINGVMDENGNKSTINGTDAGNNQYDLFEITSGNETVVEVNNTKITGANTVAIVAAGNTLTLNNVDIIDNINGIVNSGNLNLTGNNLIADNISNTTSPDGVISILSGSTQIADGANVEQGTLITSDNALLGISGVVTVTDKMNNTGKINITNSGILNLDGNNLEITGDVVNYGLLSVNGAAKNSTILENHNEMVINSSFTNDNSIFGTGTLTHKSGDFVNDSSISQKTINNEGNIVNNSNIIAETVNNQGTITTKAENLVSDFVNNDGILNYTGGTTQGTISGTGTTNIGGDLFIDSKIVGNTINLNSGMLSFTDNADISEANALNVNGGGVDVGDGRLGNVNLGNVNLNSRADLVLDFNLTNLTSDTFDANITNGGGLFNVSDINFTGLPVKDNIRIHLGDTTNLGRDNVTSDYFELPSIMTPIRRLSGNISEGWLTYGGSGNGFNDFNPSVMASPVASLVGGFLTQSQVLQDGFFHMDRYTKYSQNQRMAAENINKYADAESSLVYVNSNIPETNQGMWVKPYTTFESVDLKNGTSVSNIAYGMLYGGDTDLIDLGRGCKGVISAFIGYNGSHQEYKGIDMDQQGGTLGLTGSLYKGNFFTGITMSTGASGGEAFTAYGTDKFSMLTAGIANKTGYNIEVAQGKLIIQPSLFLGYTFANTFDYTNAAGVRIKSDPLNAIQIAPGIKLIGNLEHGWQPYLGVDMMWNIMGKTDFAANETRLPSMSVKPYVQYGAGVQKSWGKRFTAFFQTMLRNGGRTGVSLQAGFRWAIGKDLKTTDIAKTKKIIK